MPFVTAFLEQRCETLAEKALLPYAFALYFTGVSARAVNRPGSREALANGQCMLFERAVYEKLGGHASVAESVVEDVALARHAKQQGIPVHVIRAEKLGHVRMYDSLSAIWRGFQKNSFRFLLLNPWSGVQVIAASILLTSWLPVLLFWSRRLSETAPSRFADTYASYLAVPSTHARFIALVSQHGGALRSVRHLRISAHRAERHAG